MKKFYPRVKQSFEAQRKNYFAYLWKKSMKESLSFIEGKALREEVAANGFVNIPSSSENS